MLATAHTAIAPTFHRALILAVLCHSEAHRPNHANTGGSSTSKYPLFTDLRKMSVKNSRPGVIQNQVNFFTWQSRGPRLPAGLNMTIAAAPVHNAVIPRTTQKRARDITIGELKTVCFEG